LATILGAQEALFPAQTGVARTPPWAWLMTQPALPCADRSAPDSPGVRAAQVLSSPRRRLRWEIRKPAGLILSQAASWSRVGCEVRVPPRGVSLSQASSLMMLMAVAAKMCPRWVLGRPV
jgi:hypothetical protein